MNTCVSVANKRLQVSHYQEHTRKWVFLALGNLASGSGLFLHVDDGKDFAVHQRHFDLPHRHVSLGAEQLRSR